jgi:uncharacterized protein YecT (DUF1311 family)
MRNVGYLFTKFMIVIFTMIPLLASAEPKWDYSKKVEFKKNGDPGWIAFMDDSVVTIVYEKLTFEIAETWLPGKVLTIGYNEKLGAVLYDSESKKFARILEGLAPHPIDIIAETCYDGSTITNCFNESYRRWNVELNRVVSIYIENLRRRAKQDHIENAVAQEKAILAAQVQWSKFRDAQNNAISEIYARDGTIWRNVGQKREIDVIREQAQRYNNIEAW